MNRGLPHCLYYQRSPAVSSTRGRSSAFSSANGEGSSTVSSAKGTCCKLFAGLCSGCRLWLIALPSVPGFHGGGTLLLGSSGLSAQCTESSGPARFLRVCGQAGPGMFSPSGLHHCGLGQGFAGVGLAQGLCMSEPAMQGHDDALEAGLRSGSTGESPDEYGEYPDRIYGWHTTGSPIP
ncbi:UNVERIFIED_CONTAM: hypothetical protein FKN15_059719 [Acipenser sinensis]